MKEKKREDENKLFIITIEDEDTKIHSRLGKLINNIGVACILY